MDIDTERVITEVQMRPIIWDSSLFSNKNIIARRAAWLDICHEIVDNFKELSRQEKQEIEHKLQARWRTARDTYVKAKNKVRKNMKSGSGIKKGKIYTYYDMLTFLDHPSGVTDDQVYSQEESTLNTYMDDNFHSQNDNRPSISLSETHSNNTMTSNEEMELTEVVTKGKKRKQTDTDFEKEIMSFIARNTEDSQDEDWAFFHSVMPTIKKMTPNKKLKFRSMILNYLIELDG